MEEYEVDLREYVRVLWQGKWIVAACLVVSLGAAAAVSWLAADVYRAEAVLTLEPVPELSSARLDPEAVIARIEGLDGGHHLTASRDGELIRLSLQGTSPPAQLEGDLEQAVAALEEELRLTVREGLQARMDELEAQARRLDAQAAQWEAALSQARDRAEAQRTSLQQAIAAAAADPQVRALPLGEGATVGSYTVQLELDRLQARLRAVELFLDQVDRLGLRALPELAAAVARWEGDSAALQAEEERLRELLAAPPSPLAVIRSPAAGQQPVAPNRKMNLAVAGVLGLFVGVLLAFFWHWVRRPTTGGRPGETGPGPTGREAGTRPAGG